MTPSETSTIKYRRWRKITVLFLAVAVVGNGLLLLPAGSAPRSVGAMIVLLLPGLVWAEALRIAAHRLMRWTIGLGLSYGLIIVLGTLLHYLPGGISLGAVLVPLNFITLGAVAWDLIASRETSGDLAWPNRMALLALSLILLYGGFFRFTNLGYSEFQGDEVKALVPAAEAIEGRSEALFFERKKGPGEIVIPMMVWRLTELVNEPAARALFAVAGVLVILTAYILGSRLFSEPVGLLVAGLVGLNGFMVAFSRIVQYQTVVVWMSMLALLCAWAWRQDKRVRWWVLSGLFFGAGILAHYDTILVGPAVAYVFLVDGFSGIFKWSKIKGPLAGGVTALVVIGLFFVPYLLSPQVVQASRYLSRRIDLNATQTSLYGFYFFTIFYNSIYFVLLVGGLALGFLVWALVNLGFVRRKTWAQVVLAALVWVSVVCLAFWPDALTVAGVDVAFVPFTLIFLGAFLSPAVNLPQRVVIVWFATAFLVYNFVIGDPRTHFYTITLPMILLASVAGEWVWTSLAQRVNRYTPAVVAIMLVLLFSGHLYLVYLRQNPEYETDWPQSQSLMYWFPYPELSRHDTFGFVHKVGWKAVGGLYAENRLAGDYQTNGLFEISEWYTRNQLRGCYRQSTNFMAVSYRLVDMREMPDYQNIGEVSLPNDKGITIYRNGPAEDGLGPVDVAYLDSVFDNTARPAAFVAPRTTTYNANANFADAIRLTGYDITLPSAQPGEYLAVELRWQAQKEIPLDLDVFVHLEEVETAPGNGSAIWGQSNGSPACSQRPTSTWSTGESVSDLHTLQIAPNTPPGVYKLVAGLYLPQENRRVPIFDEAGNPAADAVTLTTLIIE